MVHSWPSPHTADTHQNPWAFLQHQPTKFETDDPHPEPKYSVRTMNGVHGHITKSLHRQISCNNQWYPKKKVRQHFTRVGAARPCLWRPCFGRCWDPTLGLLGLQHVVKVEYEANPAGVGGWGELRGSHKYQRFWIILKLADHLWWFSNCSARSKVSTPRIIKRLSSTENPKKTRCHLPQSLRTH